MSPLRLLPLVALALALALPAPAPAADVLPDLDQQQPDGLRVTTDRSGSIPRFHLGFESAVDDVGAGPLIIDAHRASTGEQQMTADQQVLQRDGSYRTVAGVGRLQYVYSADHNHWHYLGFDRYELRRASDYKLVAPDQKTGFCLGDRYETSTTRTLPNEPGEPVYTGYCGRGQTDLLAVEEGISVGFGDIYFANLEGQFVDLSGVPPGQYYLVHRVNADRHLLESHYANNTASLLIDLSWPNGRTAAPSVRWLRGCTRGDWCPGPAQRPPTLGRPAAERYARAALRRALGFTPRRFAVACTRRLNRVARRCNASGTHAGGRYSVAETVALRRSKRGVLSYKYVVSATRTDLACVAGKRPGCVERLPRGSGNVRLGRASASASASASAVPQPGKRLVALDDPPLDGVGLGTVVHEVPRLVRHPLRAVGRRLAAQ